jgi:MFS transporter, DHA1 family, staphyloferrin B biosynthesis exporter
MRHLMGMTLSKDVWRNFRLEALGALFVAAFIGVVGPFTAPLAVRLGASKLEMGLLTAAPFIANLTAGFWAALSQNGSPIRWVVVPHAVWRILLGLVGLMKAPWLIVATSLTAHLAVTAAGPAYGRLMQQAYPPETRGRLMGFVRVLLSGGMFVTVLFAGRLIDRFGPAWVFLGAGAAGLIGIGFFALIRVPEAGGEKRPKLKAMGQIRLAAEDPAFRRYLIAALLFHGGVLLAVPVYPQFQVQVLNLTNTEISYLAMSWTGAWLTSYAICGYLADRIGPRLIVLAAAGLYLGLPLTYAIGIFFWLILIGALCQGAADAAMDLGTWAFILQSNPEKVGAYTSAHMMAVGLRGAVAPLLGSALLGAFGMRPVFLIAAAFVAAGFLLLHTARPAPPVAPGAAAAG